MVNIQVSVVGIRPRPEIRWPEGWPVPRVGDEVSIPAEDHEDHILHVRHVDWYPHGSVNDGLPNGEPFVYVVVGPRSPI